MKKTFYLSLIFLFIFFEKNSAQISASGFERFRVDGLIVAPSTRTINYLPFSNYHFFNPSYNNPAMIGIEDKKQLNLNWNRQIENAYLVSYEQSVKYINSAFGIFVSTTYDYNTSIRNFGLAYNYGFKFKNDAKLKFGFQFSQTHFSLRQYIAGGNGPVKKWNSATSLDLGVAFQIKKLRLGMSVQNLLPVKINLDYHYAEIVNGRQQINISAANTFRVSDDWDWSLAMLLRFYDDNDPYFETPFNINDYSSYFSYRKKYFFGITSRTNTDEDDLLIWFVGLKIKEKTNLQLSFNNKSNDREDRRFFEILAQYQF